MDIKTNKEDKAELLLSQKEMLVIIYCLCHMKDSSEFTENSKAQASNFITTKDNMESQMRDFMFEHGDGLK